MQAKSILWIIAMILVLCTVSFSSLTEAGDLDGGEIFIYEGSLQIKAPKDWKWEYHRDVNILQLSSKGGSIIVAIRNRSSKEKNLMEILAKSVEPFKDNVLKKMPNSDEYYALSELDSITWIAATEEKILIWTEIRNPFSENPEKNIIWDSLRSLDPKEQALLDSIKGNPLPPRARVMANEGKSLKPDSIAKGESSQNTAWQVINESKSLMQDRRDITIATASPIKHPTGMGKDDQAVLFIMCESNKTELGVHFGTRLAESDDITIEYKIDDAPIVKSKWLESTTSKEAYANSPIPLIKKLLNSKKIVFRVKTRNAGTVETYFNLDGLDDAIKPVQTSCGWK